MKQTTRLVAAAAVLALARPALAVSGLDGCWKMVDGRIERQSGKVETPPSDCIRAYQGATLVTACRGGKEVSVYALTDTTIATYSFAQVGRHVDGKAARTDASLPRAAAFRVTGNTLHMMLGKSPGASADPIVRAEQRLLRLPAKDCAGLDRFLPAPDGAAPSRPQPSARSNPAQQAQPVGHHQQARPHVREDGHPHGGRTEQGQHQEHGLDAQRERDVLPEHRMRAA